MCWSLPQILVVTIFKIAPCSIFRPFGSANLGKLVFSTAGARHRVIHGVERFAKPFKPGQPLREGAHELRVGRTPAGPTASGEGITQHSCAARELLWRTHDHHRDVRALASAPRTTALHATNREKFAATRHGMPQFPAAAPSLRPTPECAPSVVSNASKPHLAADRHRQRQPMQRQFGQIASRPAFATAGRDCATFSRKQKYP